MSKWAGTGKAHRAKVKVGIAQGIILKRRIELWNKLKPLISNKRDKHVIEMVLRSKNISPRYW